jgi:hypothetical protein
MACLAVIAFLILAALIAGIAIGLTYAEIKHLRERIKALEASQAKHLPYHTADEIENATAAINALQFELDFKKGLLDNALAHLYNARNGRGKQPHE